MRLRHYLPKLRLNWSGSKPADQRSSSVNFCKCVSCHGLCPGPGARPWLLFWTELAGQLLIYAGRRLQVDQEPRPHEGTYADVGRRLQVSARED